ncbi:MAG TPA: DNA-processing protein DprA [Candidatus Barnesiella excrementigallinarum]|nr:DNA-processing protein DprA [Candidatus Barnesiella excrementigallinarum]
MEQELLYRIALSRLKGINKALAQHIHETVASLELFFELPEAQLQKATGITGRILHDENRKTALQEARKEIEFIQKGNITPLYFTDSQYPQRLLDCIDAPPLLYYRGNTDLNATKIVSVVGTRRATEYGKSFCEAMIRDLADYFPQLVIVSGLAYGIDICAHRSALKYGLDTVAVLAHGLDHIYPASHRNTAIEIVSHGGLLTEYPGYHPMHPAFFVARNRIVAGLADAVVIVESREKGGALITAGIAESYHRDIFALPGSIKSETSTGCNHLIRHNRAALITSADDLVEAMCWKTPPRETVQRSLFPDLTDEEQVLVDYLKEHDEAQINRMTVELNQPLSQLLSILVELEFKGVVKALPGGIYKL